MNNLKIKKRKAQFFIIAAVLIISVLFATAKLFGGYSYSDFMIKNPPDVSFIMNNIGEKFSQAIEFRENPLEPCRQEKELKGVIENWAFVKGYLINITLSKCDHIQIKSLHFDLKKTIC